MNRRRIALGIAAGTLAVGLTAAPALANVGLPYTFNIEYISGGDNGVKTPNFSSNAGGKVCVDPNLRRSHDSYYAGQNDNRFHIELWQDTTGSDTKKGNFDYTLQAQGKKCYTSVPHNKNMYLRIKKTKFVLSEKFAGSGVVSYT